ncbi:unnamed protein product [Calypogeia fissa]
MKSSGEHRRGRSMGSAPPAIIRSGEKDEDLALFHEMKRREKHNFLHPSPDDLDATLSSKFGGMGAPTKKPGTDLLTSESDKNDYDWLLTPPGTPLFPSLDQEAAALAVLSPALSNGSYSSASSATKSLKSSTYSPAESVKGGRGNPSPRRQMSTGSTTPNGISRSRSSPSTAPILTRPSTPSSAGGTRPSTPTSKSTTPSVRSSTPNLKLTISQSAKSYSNVTTPTGTRPSTPTPRSSTPTARPSTPGGRSSTPTSKPSTPTMRRSLSGGRTGITSPSPTTTRGGPSPKRSISASRGNSPSAKRITSVITSIAGMSSEVPPNLRTTMPERSTSNGKSGHSNGSTYINVEDSAQSRRRPRSPSVARSFSSSSSQEQRTSSQTSRGSVVSSYDDGLEVNRPSSYGTGRNSAAGKWHATAHDELLTAKAGAYNKRVTKSSSSKETSGYGVAQSKKSAEMVKRPVDAYQNSPTSAYRHLHSNSPVSPFYSTRTNSLLLRAGVAMNSSMTTSSNASSEHGTTVAADTEGSERDEDDLLSWDSYGRRASMSPRLQQADILVLDKDEEKTAPWQDSLFDRATSHGPSSSHSQGSQSTLDAEVTGFYETDGIASLEMLEQLGLMGENYPLKKSTSSKLRSSEKRASSNEDIKITNMNEYALSRISPSKLYQESQASPARHLAQNVDKQELADRPRRSRDFIDSKIPAHLVFQENVNVGSPTRHLANLEKQQEVPERPRKSRDFESRTSPSHKFSPAEGQGSPSRRVPQLEKQDSLERPRRSRDFDSKTSSPHRRFSLEGQGSPSRRVPLAQLEKQERVELSRSRKDFETELIRRSGEKLLGVVEPQAPSSEIRAACLFVRDFKVGVSSPQSQDSPFQAEDVSPGGAKRHGIEEMEMKLRNELSSDWDNSMETVDLLQPSMGLNGDTERRLSDSALLISGPKKSSARLSLEFPLITPVDAVYQTKINDSLAIPIDARKPDLRLLKDVEFDHHPTSMNGTQTSAENDDSSVQDGMMDESEIESPPPKEVDMDSPISPERSRPNGRDYSTLDLQRAAIRETLQFTSQLLGIQSGLSDDGVYAMDEDATDIHFPEDGTTASLSDDEAPVLEGSTEGGHLDMMQKQISAMDVDEVTISALPEKHTGDALGGIHNNFLLAGIEQEVVNVLQSSEEDAASEGLGKMDYCGTGVAEVVEDGMWYSEAGNNQQDVVESFLQAVPFSTETTGPKVVEKELCYGGSAVESDAVHVSDRQVEQGVHSNGNHLLPNSKSAAIPEKEPISHHVMGSVWTNVKDDHILQKLPVDAYKVSPVVDVKEISPWNLQICSAKIEDNQESALDESYNTASVDHGLKDLKYVVMTDGTQDPIVEVVDTKASQGVVNGVFDLRNRQGQEDSQKLEYVGGDFVAPVEDTGDEAGYKLSNHFSQEELHSPIFSKSESAAKEDISFPKFSSDEAYEEDTDFFHKKVTEFDARCVENQQLSYASADFDDCQPKAVQFDEKAPEVLDLSPNSEDISEVQASKHEFRSASTLCAALEEQIAGLIQKIDSAIEESSKPFSPSPQESLLLKDKRSILETQQDECTGSMRSSQEEDLIDMLWAEDGETSCSEESRDQDFLNSKDCSSQREMNGVVRSCRLSGSILGQSNDGGYDAVVRASRSDLGVEKRMLEGSSKRSGVLPVQQLDDVVHMQIREPLKSPVKSPVKSPLKVSLKSPVKSPVKSPFLWSREINAHDSLPEAHFHLDAESKTEKSIGEGGQANPYGDLQTVASGREHGGDILMESSSSYDEEERKTDAQVLSLCKAGEQSSGDSDLLKNSAPVLAPARAETGENEVFLPKETVDSDAVSAEESTREAGETIKDAERALPSEDMALENASHEEDMGNDMSNGNSLTLEARDQAIQEQAHNRDRDESPILLTLARSELTSKAGNEFPNEEWLHRKTMLPEEASSRPAPSAGHITEEAMAELNEDPQRFEEPEVEMMEDSPSSSLASEVLDLKETRDNIDNLVGHVDIGSVQMPEEEVDVHPWRLPPQNEVSLVHTSLGAGPSEKPESPSLREIEEVELGTPEIHDVSNGIIESSRLPERNSATQSVEANADAEVKGADPFTGQEWQQRIPRDVMSPNKSQISSPHGGGGRSRRYDEIFSEGSSPSKAQISPRGGAVRSRRYDEIPSEAPAVVQELWMSQGCPESPSSPFSNGSGEEAQIHNVKPNQRHRDSFKGQHISLISGNKISTPERESFRMEETDSGTELGRQDSSRSSGMEVDMIGREDVSSEAHAIDVPVKPQESETHFQEEGVAENHQEGTRLSVIRSRRDLPALNLNSPRLAAASNDEIKAHHDELGVTANGNGDLGTGEDKDSREGSQSVKRLPLNKAKSVRTISLSPRSRIQSSSEEPRSPGEVFTPHKCDAFNNITVISPESLQWDHSSPAAETPSKSSRSSTPSLSRNMTLAEATDTILFCSSLMHTIVYKAAAYAIEKEELAALASTPTSNGEAPHCPDVSLDVNREGSDPQVDETGSCKPQGVTNGPPSARRALSYTGHQTVPLTPADTSLQIPVDQVIEKVNAPTSTAKSPSPAKNQVVPVKASKAKCGCTIM